MIYKKGTKMKKLRTNLLIGLLILGLLGLAKNSIIITQDETLSEIKSEKPLASITHLPVFIDGEDPDQDWDNCDEREVPILNTFESYLLCSCLM